MFETSPISIQIDSNDVLVEGTDFYPVQAAPRIVGQAQEETPACAGATAGKVFGRGNARFKITLTAMRTHASHAAAVEHVINQSATLTGMQGTMTGTKHAATQAHINTCQGDVDGVTSILVVQITCTGLSVSV